MVVRYSGRRINSRPIFSTRCFFSCPVTVSASLYSQTMLINAPAINTPVTKNVLRIPMLYASIPPKNGPIAELNI